jgi:BASS family bile acid:Na+ symporter
MSSLVPEWFLSAFALATVFTVMFDVGLGIVPGEFLWLWRRPALMLKALFAVLVAVPAIALLVSRTLDLPRAAEVGLMVMAISPGAPVALQRSLGAGGHRSFAPGLQITVALLAVVSMPLSIAALNEVYSAHASVGPWQLMKQVSIAQLLPLGLGVGIGRLFSDRAAWLKPRLFRLWRFLMLSLAVLAIVGFWGALLKAGPYVAIAVVLTTAGAIAAGHGLGGPNPATRTAVAISSSARNPGLALLVVAVNGAPPAIKITVLSYIVVSALTILPYVIWRKRQVSEFVAQGPRLP